MKPESIKMIAARALSGADSILSHWLPNAKREGEEYKPLNPKRSDNSTGSFSINTRSGQWADFADGAKGNDLVSLVAYLEDLTQSEAAKLVAEFLNIRIENDPPERATKPQNRKGDMKTPPEKQRPQGTANDDGWKCVMPVPDGAPNPPDAHPRHGKPSRRYEYLTGYSARTNFYHDRFDIVDGKKQFAPLTLWQRGKTFRWQFKAPPDPRPLFGLIGLFAYADADCWIVEGEKAAIALETLLPNHPVLTWQGGSNATAKADYVPLEKRHCIVFRDNDPAGMKACLALIECLRAVNPASIRVLDISKLERSAGEPLQPGDDAADLVEAGWTAERFAEFLKRDGVLIDADAFTSEADPDSNEASGKQPDDAGTIERFTLFDKGLFVNEQLKDGSSHIRWICSPIKPLAMVRTEHSRDWGLLIWLVDPDGKEKKIILGMRAFNGDALAASGELLDAGLRIGSGTARKLVIEYLQTSTPDKRAKTTNKTGWHGSDLDEMVFVLPEKTIGESSEGWLYGSQLPDSNPYRQKGTLKQWHESVAALCTGNSRLVFSLCTAFASSLLHLLGLESGGFQLTGKSSTGKSTALFVAASVCGGRDYLQRWRSTDNGLESLAQSRSDSLLVLDEVKQLDGKIAAEAAYMLANGTGKVRSNANGTSRSVAAWRLLFLSSGELSLSQHVTDAGKKAHAGMEIRLCDIPADASAGMGLFENIHGYESASKFAETLAANAGKYYGTAFIAFIEHVLQNREAIPAMLKDCEKAFAESVLTDNASGQARRVAGRFALVAAAGELATQWGVTGWQPGESMTAAITCFKAWLAGYGGEGNKEEREMLAQVRRFLEAHTDRFVLIDRASDSHAPKTLNRAGYRKPANDGLAEYLVLPETFKTEVCKGFDYRDVFKLLSGKGYVRSDAGRNLFSRANLPLEGRVRVAHILPSIWGDDEDG